MCEDQRRPHEYGVAIRQDGREPCSNGPTGPCTFQFAESLASIMMRNGTSFQRLVRSRRSVRAYSERPVERQKILTCIEAARLAPSAENIQPWRFVVIDDPHVKEEFRKAAFSGIYSPSRFAAKAPVIVVILGKKDLLANVIGRQIQGTAWYLIDIGIAGEHIVLQAQELGLSTCWIGWFHAKKVRTFLHIPATYKAIALIAMGYSAERPLSLQKRKPIEKIFSFNRFGRGEKERVGTIHKKSSDLDCLPQKSIQA